MENVDKKALKSPKSWTTFVHIWKLLYCTGPGPGTVPDLSDRDEYEYRGDTILKGTNPPGN